MNDLYHIDENSKWEMVLGNIQNMIQYLDQEALYIPQDTYFIYSSKHIFFFFISLAAFFPTYR